MKSIYLSAIILVLNISFVCTQTIDDSFHGPVAIRPAKIECIKILPDGKILLGGDIAFFKTKSVNNLIRLNTDNTIDETFSFNGNNFLLIEKIELLNTGDLIVLAQDYKSLTNTYSDHYSLFCLNSSGEIKKEIDSLITPHNIAVQDDDKVLVCGTRSTEGYLYRYNPDLSLDTAFDNRISFNSGVADVRVNKDRIFVSGMFSLVNDTIRNSIVKLNLNGTIDSTFNTGLGTSDYIGSLTFQADDKILIGKTYINSFNGQYFGGIVRLNPDGSVDDSFHPPALNGSASEILIRDSSIYFSASKDLNGVFGSYLFKLTPNGGIDNTFNPILLDDTNPFEFCMAFQRNSLIFNSSFLAGNIYGLSLCDSAGSFVNSFAPEISRYGVIKVGDYFNGKLVVSGDFVKINELETYGIALLNDDGTVDETFVLKQNLGNGLQIKILNDSSLLFSTGKAFIKINSHAQVMADFNFSHFKTLYQVIKFRVLENGKIIAADGNNVYRLNADGTEDTDFDIGSGIGSTVSTAFDFDLQNDKVIFGSIFDNYNGTGVNKLMRLNADASLDQTFDIGTGPDDLVSMIKVLTSGEVLVGGYFKSFDGNEIPHGLVKLSANGAMDIAFNENQKNSPLCEVYWYNPKVEQSDSMIYIRAKDAIGLDTVVALNVDGKIDGDFNMPLIVNRINDIVVLNENSQIEKKTKSDNLNDKTSYMFALGNFKLNEGDGASFIIKFSIGSETGPTPVSDLNAEGSGYQLYPIPVKDKLLISFSEIQPHTMISIYDLNGMQLHSSKITTASGEVDMSKYVPGIYFVRIVTSEGRVSTTKIVKQ